MGAWLPPDAGQIELPKISNVLKVALFEVWALQRNPCPAGECDSRSERGEGGEVEMQHAAGRGLTLGNPALKLCRAPHIITAV